MRKPAISFVMFVRVSVCPHGTTQLPVYGFSWNLIFEGILHEAQYTLLIISRSVLLRTRNSSDKSRRANQNTHFTFNNFTFRKSCRLWDNVEKYSIIGQATDYKMAHAHCILDTQGYKKTFKIWNTYCCYTATMVARTPPNVTLYVHCLSCFFYRQESGVKDTKN